MNIGKMLFRLYTGLNINKEKVDKITLNRDFTDIIKATLKQYRKAQMKLLRVAFLAIFVMIFIPVGLYHGNEILQKHPEAMIAISAPFVLGGFYAIFGLAISYWTDYEDFFKANLISNIIKDIDDNFTYIPKKIRDLDEAFGECSFLIDMIIWIKKIILVVLIRAFYLILPSFIFTLNLKISKAVFCR